MAASNPANNDQPEEAGKKSSSLKWVIIIVLLVVLAGGGGAIVWLKFIKAGPDASYKPAAAAPIIHPLETFLVNLSDPGGKRYLKLSMELALDTIATQEEVKNRNFALRDAVLMLLTSKSYDDISSTVGKTVLKREVVDRLNRLLERGQVKDVYFTDFLVQ